MQRINLLVKILVSQVNTDVLLHENLDIRIPRKILPCLKREQKKREKQKGEKATHFRQRYSCYGQSCVSWGAQDTPDGSEGKVPCSYL